MKPAAGRPAVIVECRPSHSSSAPVGRPPGRVSMTRFALAATGGAHAHARTRPPSGPVTAGPERQKKDACDGKRASTSPVPARPRVPSVDISRARRFRRVAASSFAASACCAQALAKGDAAPRAASSRAARRVASFQGKPPRRRLSRVTRTARSTRAFPRCQAARRPPPLARLSPVMKRPMAS